MRRKIVAGNWKMNGSRSQAAALVEGIKQGAEGMSDVDIIVFPSFVHLQTVENILKGSNIHWGAQNLYMGESGAFTGEVSGPMLADYGCQYALVGHSERRTLFHENLQIVATKFNAALAANLRPILCVGETLEQREKKLTEQVIQEQIESVIEVTEIDVMLRAIIAYEPVWAIGTGLTATPEQAQEVHAFIRNLLTKFDPAVAKSTSLLYGGSVKQDNAAGLFAMPDIDGALVGGASLDVKGFLGICKALTVGATTN